MMSNGDNEKVVWENWLDDFYGNELRKIREAVRRIYDENKKKHADLPFFTPHGPEHCQNVEDLIHKILSGNVYKKFTIKERYYLLASAWLHDLGMLPLVYESVYKKSYKPHLNEVREKHHVTSEKYIIEQWSDLCVDENDKEIIGKLCRYHRRSEPFSESDEVFLVDKESFRLMLLASYLRLADSLDISASRAPSEPYAICLAYDIPEDSKLHWIKSRLISGINLDTKNHTITIQFKCPYPDGIGERLDLADVNDKIDSIIKLVIDDLKEELSSVINVIIKFGGAYFLDIKAKKSYVSFNDQMLSDLRGLVLNYDIMMAPSASRLLEIILSTTANILLHGLSQGEKPTLFDGGISLKEGDGDHVGELKKKANEFLTSMKNNVLHNRPCHFGLKNLVIKCEKILHKEDSLLKIIKSINKLFQDHHTAREYIRIEASDYFSSSCSNLSDDKEVNILLYGYSELTTKAICGLRDSFIKKKYDCIKSEDIYNSNLETQQSERIKIFICEGQPKTQTNYNDRLIYHDGSQYAFHLKRRGFNNIVLIPDIIAGTLLDKIKFQFVILGANGVSPQYFTHSAGHLAIVNLASDCKSWNKNIKIVLVTSSEKYNSDDETLNNHSNSNDQSGNNEDDDIFCAIDELPKNRDHIWFTSDSGLLSKLRKDKISLLNPREDRVQINKVDAIITDIGCKLNDDTNDFEKELREMFNQKSG